MSGVRLPLLTLGLVQFTMACSLENLKECDKEGCWALKKDENGRRGSWWQVELECRICGNNNPQGCNIESCAYMAKDHNTDSKKYGWISECSACGVCTKGERALGSCNPDPDRSADCPDTSGSDANKFSSDALKKEVESDVNGGPIFAIVFFILVLPAMAVAFFVYRNENEKKNYAKMKEEDNVEDQVAPVYPSPIYNYVVKAKSVLGAFGKEPIPPADVAPAPPPGEPAPPRPLVVPPVKAGSPQPPLTASTIPGQIDDEVRSEGASSEAPSLPPKAKEEVEV